jgi:hypothetical protein
MIPAFPLHSHHLPTRACSSVYGKIELLFLSYPGGLADVPKEQIIERYGNILKAFDDRVQFVVLGHFGEKSDLYPQARASFEQALADLQFDPASQLLYCHTSSAGNRDLRSHDVHSGFAQDPLLAMESAAGSTVLLEPIQQENPENHRLAEYLAAYGGFLVQPSDLRIEGGNILVGDDYALVGQNVITTNLPLGAFMAGQEGAAAWVESRLRQLLGVRFLLPVGLDQPLDLGGFHSTGKAMLQPFYHLDLFATLAGKTKEGKELVFLGKINTDHVEDLKEEDLPFLGRINASLEGIATRLKNARSIRPGPHFEVVRLEMGGRIQAAPDGTRAFLPFSYNNAHVECFDGVKRIYLPHFPKLEALEIAARSTLKRHGFDTPVFIDGGFRALATLHGSLRCLTNVLGRRRPC